VYDAYYNLASAYSERKLTFQRDKESAFSAIVAQFQNLLKVENLYGLWINDLAHGLVWKVRGSRLASKSNIPKDLNGIELPSWSWHCHQRGISWPSRDSGPDLAANELSGFANESFRYSEASEDAPAKLSIYGYIKEGICLKKLAWGTSIASFHDKTIGVEFDEVDLNKVTAPVKVWLLVLYSRDPKNDKGFVETKTLFVEPAGAYDVFRRVGVARGVGSSTSSVAPSTSSAAASSSASSFSRERTDVVRGKELKWITLI
jgi:hypothetical protein